MSFTDQEKQQWSGMISIKLEEAKKDLSSHDGWEFIKEQAGLSAYRKDVPNDHNKKIKGGGVIKTDMSSKEVLDWFLDQFSDVKKRKVIDPLCNLRQEVAKLTDELSVYHMQYDSPAILVSCRDSMNLYKTVQEADKFYIIGVSIDHTSLAKPAKGYVRMNNKMNVFSIEQKNEGEVEVWNISHLDPAGNIPSWLSNGQEAMMFVLKMRDLMQNRK